MSNDFTAIPRLFNSAVKSAKKYGSESMHNTEGQYINNGWDRLSSDGYGNSRLYKDRNRDRWVDEIVEKKNGKVFVEAQNTNPYNDNIFDSYKEYQNGNLYRTVQDQNKNGNYDLVELYEYGKKTQSIEDINDDGEPELYTFYDSKGNIIEQIDTRSNWEKFWDSIF